jgi:hypothetical protein
MPFDALCAKAQLGVVFVGDTGGSFLKGMASTGMQGVDFVCVDRDAQAVCCWTVMETRLPFTKLSKLRVAVYYGRKTPESRQIGS